MDDGRRVRRLGTPTRAIFLGNHPACKAERSATRSPLRPPRRVRVRVKGRSLFVQHTDIRTARARGCAGVGGGGRRGIRAPRLQLAKRVLPARYARGTRVRLCRPVCARPHARRPFWSPVISSKCPRELRAAKKAGLANLRVALLGDSARGQGCVARRDGVLSFNDVRRTP